MTIRSFCCLCYVVMASLLPARSTTEVCGTYPGNWRESLDHHQKTASRLRSGGKVARSAVARRDADIGNVAVMENDDFLFSRRNPFNLDRMSLTFVPAGKQYTYTTGSGGYDQVAAGSGNAIAGLGDDDTRRVALPFAFRFYGTVYRELWLNSDGNVTFGAGDNASSARSLGRMAAGPPRIAPLFSDLDPSVTTGVVRVLSTPTEFTVSWIRVREYSDFGTGRAQTFQLRLSPNGSIFFAWDGVNIADGVVGIAPGDSTTRPMLASFLATKTGSSEAMIAERFGDAQALDLVAASRRFYETHDDAYDYLAFFNTTGVPPGISVIAFETTVRTARYGIGDIPVDVGREYGSPNRLQAVLNMGPVNSYPVDPNAPHPLRSTTGDTGLTVFAHEIGHLFLAYASVRDPRNPAARPMLGRQLFHWNFRFNSEASLLEGNRIRDDGPNATPRFTTVATVEGFSPLDQYLMGLRAPGEVPPTFLVENATTGLTDPRVGVTFNGSRRNVSVEDLIAVEGPRIPAYPLDQNRYRMGIVLIVPAGETASPADLATLERYRQEVESAWPRYTGGRATMEGSLRRAVRLSIEPAIGVVGGETVKVTVSVQDPAPAPLAVALLPVNGFVEGPASAVIPAGERSVGVELRAVRLGVETLRAEPIGDTRFMSTEGRINIVPTYRALRLRVLTGDRQTLTPGTPLPEAIVLKLTDENDLPYPGVRIVSVGSGVSPASAITGADGRVTFQWTPAAGELPLLRFAVEGQPLPVAAISATGPPAVAEGSVVNAASFRPGITPGGIATIFGLNVSEPTVTVNGLPAQVFYADYRQVNFSVPNVAAGTATVRILTALGATTVSVPVLPVQPGIFVDAATGLAAAIDRGSRIFEVYGTGFGTASQIGARAGGRDAEVLFHGLAPGFIGLFQTNIRVDAAVPAGEQPISLIANGIVSNEARLAVGR